MLHLPWSLIQRPALLSRLRPKPSTQRVSALARSAACLSLSNSKKRNGGFQLRPYQEECVQTVLRAFEQGRRQVGVSLATGAGKTVIFTELIGRMISPRAAARQVLILVHRQELVEQAAKHCSSRYPDKKVDIEMGNMHASGRADVTVASIQSINSRDRIDKFDPSRFKLILVDEAHHIVASSYLNVLSHFGLQSDPVKPEAPALCGVSATFGRHDGLALGKAIKHIVYHKDYIDMIGESWLSDVIFTTVQSKAHLSAVRTSKTTGDFLPSSLSAAVNTSENNLVTVRSWLSRANDRRSTLVFCVDIAHLTSLAQTFRAHGVDARFVTGDTHRKLRSERLDAFKRGDYPVLLNCGVFTEGTDIPNVDCVILARPTKSRNLLIQMIGRGMRLSPGKDNCHIIDMVASLEGGIVTTPSLLGLDADATLDATRPSDARKSREAKERERLCDEEMNDQPVDASMTQQRLDRNITFTQYNSVNDLISDTSGERHIRALSSNAWVCIGEDKYILQGGGASGSYLAIERTTGERLFIVRFTAKLTTDDSKVKSPFMRPRQVAAAETLESAVRGADTFADKVFARTLITTRRPMADWRYRDASQAQVDYLNKIRGEDEKLEVGDITKGDAGDAITKMKHGAKGRFNSMQKARRKVLVAQKKVAQDKQRRLNEHIQVGPVSVDEAAVTD